MANRVKYPLTDDAKKAATLLAAAWKDGDLDQQFMPIEIATSINGKNTYVLSIDGISVNLLWVNFLELSMFGLLDAYHVPNGSKRVILLQELLNAVENDFKVSDYFLTVNAVGTIVQGNLEVKEGAIFQSAAATHDASITQNTGVIADKIENILGTEILQDEKLQEAIIALRGSNNEPKENRLQKMGTVIQELGRCLSHGANASVVIGAITYLSQILNLL